MSSLKTLFVAAILVGGLYGAYMLLNYNPEATASSESSDQWPSALNISPGTATTAPRWNSDGTPSAAPSFSTTPGEAGPAPVAVSPGSESSFPSPAAPPFQQRPADSPTAIPSGPSAPGSPAVQFPTAGSAPGWPDQTPAPGAPADEPQFPTVSNPDAPLGTSPMGPPAGREDYATFKQRVSQVLAENRLAEALRMLSERYFDPNTSPVEASELQALLDQLAGTVIYSPQSFLEAPYEVMANDTIESIAGRCNVPTGLLIKINGLDPNLPLQPGQQLKVVSGGFAAIVDLSDSELTLLLDAKIGKLYAGRFKIGVGPELREPRESMVREKVDLTDPSNYNAFPPHDIRGTRWIDLGPHVGLHGTNRPEAVGQPMQQGCISLGQRDIEDLFDILSIGSTVTIRQ